MAGRSQGRVALVTGGAAGIGQAYAQRLAREGARVVIGDLADASETVSMVEAAGSQGLGVRCDVSRPEDVAALARTARNHFGPVDVLVHNAGIYPVSLFADMDFEQWRTVMSVNLDSMFHVCHEMLPEMRNRGWGRIMCISSTTFHAGAPGMAHYVASKGALIGFVRALASEVGQDGVTVNAIAPSLVRSKGTLEGPHESMGLFEAIASQQAIKRTQQPADLVGTVAFLASDDAAFMTGQTLIVDGGWMHA